MVGKHHPIFWYRPSTQNVEQIQVFRQESQTAVTVAFKIGPINATDKISICRSQNLLHVMKRSKSVSRAEEIIGRNLK